MSVKVVAWVFEYATVKGAAWQVLVVLADAANDDGFSAYPSRQRIALRTNLSEKAVREAWLTLERGGWIKADERLSPRGTRSWRVLMRDDLPKKLMRAERQRLEQRSATPGTNGAPGDEGGPDPGTAGAPSPVPAVPRTVLGPVLEPSSLRSEDARVDDEKDELPKIRHGRKVVSVERHRLALDILAAFNRLMGTGHGPYKGTGGPSPSLSRILTFLAEATTPVTLDVAERMIEHARLNPYWNPSPPTTGNVFSGQAGERNLQAAAGRRGDVPGESVADRMVRLSQQATEEAERHFEDPSDRFRRAPQGGGWRGASTPPSDPDYEGFERVSR